MTKLFITLIYLQLACLILVAFAKPIDDPKNPNDSLIVIIKKPKLDAPESLINENVIDREMKQLKRERRSPGFWEFLCGRLKSCT